MFTGLIAALGTVREVRKIGDGMELWVDLGGLGRPLEEGESIALSGVCCTVTRWRGSVAAFDLSAETLRRTWLGDVEPGRRLNLEGALRAGDPLGGHLVQGHVDGVGRVVGPIGPEGGEWWVEVPQELARYCVEKGSIALDGVSLTIAAIEGPRVMIAIIPHTAAVTTVGDGVPDRPLHVEVDVLAKYVEKMVAPWGPRPAGE